MTPGRHDDRERELEQAAREYGRLLSFHDRSAREQILRKYTHLSPEIEARLAEVEELLGVPTKPHTTLTAATMLQQQEHMVGREWRSETELFGWPLVHVAHGIDPETGRPRVARGVIALGNVAIGGLAMGGAAFGGVAIGGFAVGVFSLGGLALGGLVLGGCAVGLIAVGGLAVGIIAMGGFAVGSYAAGGAAIGTYVVSGAGQDPEAVALFSGIRDGIKSLFGG